MYLLCIFFAIFLSIQGFSDEGKTTKISQEMRDLIDRCSFDSSSYLELLDILIPHDAEFAQKLYEKDGDSLFLKSDAISIQLAIASQLSSEKAKEILSELKRKYFYDSSTLKDIYKVEKKRCFPESEETLYFIRQAVLPNDVYDFVDLIECLDDPEEKKELLEKAHEYTLKTLKEPPSAIYRSALARLLRSEVQENSFLALETACVMKDYARRLEGQMIKEGHSEDYARRECLDFFEDLLSSEAKSSILQDQFLQDFSEFILLIKEYVEKDPDCSLEADIVLDSLLDTLIFLRPQEARQILSLIDDLDCFLDRMRQLLENQEIYASIDQEELKEEILRRINADNGNTLVRLDYLSSNVFYWYRFCSEESALSHLQKIKESAEFLSGDEDRVEALSMILRLEVDAQLPSMRETAKKLYQFILEKDLIIDVEVITLLKSEIAR